MLLIRQKILLENDCQETSNMMPLSFHPQFVCLKKDLKVRVFLFLFFFFSPPFILSPRKVQLHLASFVIFRWLSSCSSGTGLLGHWWFYKRWQQRSNQKGRGFWHGRALKDKVDTGQNSWLFQKAETHSEMTAPKMPYVKADCTEGHPDFKRTFPILYLIKQQ